MGEKWNNLIYDTLVWVLTFVLSIFFRETKSRGSWQIPRQGPVIFVAAPHANQFVDPLLLLKYCKRRVGFCAAKKTMDRTYVGFFARALQSIPVIRAQDLTKTGSGQIFLPDPVKTPTKVSGIGTKFTTDCAVNGTLSLPAFKSLSSPQIIEIISDTELILKSPFIDTKPVVIVTPSSNANTSSSTPSSLNNSSTNNNNSKISNVNNKPNPFLTSPSQPATFKYTPPVSHDQLLEQVRQRLIEGKCVGIFPEGGSHDRTEFLPLKAGVAMMTLGTMWQHPEANVKLVPVGLNYFNPHKFRSRAVIEFGAPIEIPKELVAKFGQGGLEKREAVSELMETILKSLKALTVTAPDYETLMVIQAARRLYKPVHKRLDVTQTLELTRRFAIGFAKFKDDERIQLLRKQVQEYNRLLNIYGLRDHQVATAKLGGPRAFGLFLGRIFSLCLFGGLALPGAILNAPIALLCSYISHKKAKEALASSTVKIQARDVLATWKIMVATIIIPNLYIFYSILIGFYFYQFVPLYDSLFKVIRVSLFTFTIALPFLALVALHAGENGLDVLRSLKPLYQSIFPHRSAKATASDMSFDQDRLRKMRKSLSKHLRQVINVFGPLIIANWGSGGRIIGQDALNEEATAAAHVRKSKSHESFGVRRSPRSAGFSGLSPLGGGSPTRNASGSGILGLGLIRRRQYAHPGEGGEDGSGSGSGSGSVDNLGSSTEYRPATFFTGDESQHSSTASSPDATPLKDQGQGYRYPQPMYVRDPLSFEDSFSSSSDSEPEDEFLKKWMEVDDWENDDVFFKTIKKPPRYPNEENVNGKNRVHFDAGVGESTPSSTTSSSSNLGSTASLGTSASSSGGNNHNSGGGVASNGKTFGHARGTSLDEKLLFKSR